MSASVPMLTVRSLHATAVDVPMTYALGTSRQRVTSAPLLLIDLLTEQGITVTFDSGHGAGSHGRLYFGSRFTTLKDRRSRRKPG